MKVIAILENDVTAGGGFNQALSAVLQMKRICGGRFDFEIFTTRTENISYLGKLGLDAVGFSFSIVDKFISKFSLSPWWQFVQWRLKIISPFEKKLLQHQCDLVYFVAPSSISIILQRLNYIMTVWDLCHRDMPEFPEVRYFCEFYRRERHFQNSLSPAIMVMAASEQLSDAISRRYGVDHERCLAMPFSPAPFLDPELAVDKNAVLKKYGLEEGYLFYPAQFWAHKNHIRILEALVSLRDKGVTLKVVFAGGNQGNRSHIENFITCHDLWSQVQLLGFVPADDMRGLYEGCCAVVMPTYFGPTNLPPIEAWMMGKPLVYSSHLKEQIGEAALCVNPDDPQELADAMQACTCHETQAELARLGMLKLRQLEQQCAEAEKKLLASMIAFEVRRRCWA